MQSRVYLFMVVCSIVDHESRGNVLEPEDTVEIKFCQKNMAKVMTRLDNSYFKLQRKLKSPSLPSVVRGSVEAQLKDREEFLSSTFHQVAVKFADLHDTPGRMLKKGCVKVSSW